MIWPQETLGNIWRQFWSSLVAQLVKNLPAMQDTWIQSLGWEDLLEKGMATHSNILSWRIPWTEELGGLQSMGLQRVGHNWAIKHSTACVSLVAQMVKNPHIMQETWVLSLGGEDALVKGMTIHSSILAWRFPWREKSGGVWSIGSQSWTWLKPLSTYTWKYVFCCLSFL